MSVAIVARISLVFLKENKHKVEALVKKQFKGAEKIVIRDTDISFSIWNSNLVEENFEEFKEVCTYFDLNIFWTVIKR